MESLLMFLDWFNRYSGAIGVVLALLTVALPFLSFIHVKKREIQQKQFETYHNLIKQLVEGDNPNSNIYLDRQIAIVFELKNFKTYYPVTRRILAGLREKWVEKDNNASYSVKRLIEEVDLTLEAIKNK